MNKQDAEKIITEYLKPIFGFALKHCKNIYDAEDLSQEIVLKSFRALLIKDDIGDIRKFIWTIAHNSLSNYYRDYSKGIIGEPIDKYIENIANTNSIFNPDKKSESVHHLQSEIAYLSKLQRKIIIAYYFENRKQSDIAKDFNLPIGTVKWHLFEAKKELKRGMDTMRKTSELKFNPIQFHSYGINGSVGTKNLDEFFRSILSQNICYCLRNETKTINEIADALGVSPVYIEPEVDFLEKYGFLKQNKDKYTINFIINEPTSDLLIMQDKMYKKAAELFANELYDELIDSKLLEHPDICYGQKNKLVSSTESSSIDRNFLLWSLIPYITSESGEKLINNKISFEEVATIRPDGAFNICHASVVSKSMNLPENYVHMKNFCGPFRYSNSKYSFGNTLFWQLDTEWSERRINVSKEDIEKSERVLSLKQKEEKNGILSKDEYTWLLELGYIHINGEYSEQFKSSWQIITLASQDIKNKLISIGDKIKTKYKAELDAIKAPYVEMELKSVPAHLRKIKEYESQFIFHSDGWFLLHCIVTLLNNKKLKLPTKEQRKVLSTLIVPND